MIFKRSRDTKKALLWIVGILRKHSVPFQITGGFAAKIYGSSRHLNDIDIDIPENYFAKILPDVKQYIIYGPAQYNDEKWNLYLMTLNYEGQEIDIGSGNVKISTKDRTQWISFNTDFSNSITKNYLGIEVPVIPKSELISYKQLLDGDHQIIDIESIK